jgi:hypothetical protein
MFTLKVHFTRSVEDEQDGIHRVIDDTTIFAPADFIRVNVVTDADEILATWPQFDSDVLDCRNHVDQTWEPSPRNFTLDTTVTGGGMTPTQTSGATLSTRHYDLNVKLIEVVYRGETSWYLVTRAWLLGEDGRTIERIAP